VTFSRVTVGLLLRICLILSIYGQACRSFAIEGSVPETDNFKKCLFRLLHFTEKINIGPSTESVFLHLIFNLLNVNSKLVFITKKIWRLNTDYRSPQLFSLFGTFFKSLIHCFHDGEKTLGLRYTQFKSRSGKITIKPKILL
jgi:hypothetical protein